MSQRKLSGSNELISMRVSLEWSRAGITMPEIGDMETRSQSSACAMIDTLISIKNRPEHQCIGNCEKSGAEKGSGRHSILGG